MKKRKSAIAIIILIGVGCFGVGFSNVCGYITGYEKLLSNWYDNTPMIFSTSIIVMFIGLALYLTGKTLDKHDKTIR